MPLPRGRVTFVFTDIEGSTALFHELGDGFLAVLDMHNRELREAWTGHGGVEVKTEGDAFFVAFADPAAAVAACADGQRRMAGCRWPHGGTVKVRMGLHTGPVEVVDDDYVGLSVAEAARVASAGHGGQVLLSEATAAEVRDHLATDVGLRDLGRHSLKDFPEPRRLFQLTGEGLAVTFPPPRTLTARSHNLPALATSLVGRAGDIRAVQDLLIHQARLVTVTGPGGIGKSRLTIEVAWGLLSWFREGVWFVSLAHLDRPGDIDQAVAAALGLKESQGVTARYVLVGRLSEGPSLLVLDNFEHLLEGATVVSDLLAACPDLRVLASSRERLRLRGEHRIVLDALPPAEGATLFRARAEAAGPGSVTADDDDRVERICGRLDNIPLALELAAARLGDVDLGALEADLEHALAALVEGDRDLPDRQRTLEATIDWSYRLLDGRERSVLQAASVFAGRGSLAALLAVHGDDADEATVATRSLTAKSLVQAGLPGPDGGERWWLLQTIREFAADRLAAEPEAGPDPGASSTETGGADDRRATLTAAHAQWYRGLAAEAAATITGPAQARQIEALRTDLDNIRTALGRLDGDALLETAADLGRFWFRAGLWQEGLIWSERALDASSPTSPPAAVAMLAMTAGMLAGRLGRTDEALSRLSRALDTAAAAGDPALLAECQVQMSEAHRLAGDLDASEVLAVEAFRVATDAGDDRLVATAANTLGAVAYRRGDLEAAERHWGAGADAARRSGDAAALGPTLNNLGLVSRQRGQAVTAEAFYRERLALAEEVDDRPGQATATYNLAAVVNEGGRSGEALVLLAAAEAMFETLGDRAMRAWCRIGRLIFTGVDLADPATRATLRSCRAAFLATADARGAGLAEAMLAEAEAEAEGATGGESAEAEGRAGAEGEHEPPA